MQLLMLPLPLLPCCCHSYCHCHCHCRHHRIPLTYLSLHQPLLTPPLPLLMPTQLCVHLHLAPTTWSRSFVPTHLCACSHQSLCIRACSHLFACSHLHLAFVPTHLRPLFALVCAHSPCAWPHHLVMLVWPLLVLAWGSPTHGQLCLFGVICTCPASHLCLYQIYSQYIHCEQTYLYIMVIYLYKNY